MMYAFIIGAAKCGTTSLAEMLAIHPDIDVSNPKETNYFTNEGILQGYDWYEKLFDNNNDFKYRIDASVSYSAGWGGDSKNIAERIFRFSPNAKIIYLIRDPIERTRAAYWHAVRSGYENLSLWDSIQNKSIDHITASQYSDRIDDYLAYFPKENVFVASSHTLKTDTLSTVNEICDHLGLPRFDNLELRQETNKTYQLSGIGKYLHRILPYDFIKKAVKIIKRRLPNVIVHKLVNIYSKPIPELTEREARYLYDLYLSGTNDIKRRYGIDLQHCHWWRQFGN
jgi:hypothetical protein